MFNSTACCASRVFRPGEAARDFIARICRLSEASALWNSGMHRLFDGQGQKEGHFSAIFGSQEGTLAQVLAPRAGSWTCFNQPRGQFTVLGHFGTLFWLPRGHFSTFWLPGGHFSAHFSTIGPQGWWLRPLPPLVHITAVKCHTSILQGQGEIRQCFQDIKHESQVKHGPYSRVLFWVHRCFTKVLVQGSWMESPVCKLNNQVLSLDMSIKIELDTEIPEDYSTIGSTIRSFYPFYVFMKSLVLRYVLSTLLSVLNCFNCNKGKEKKVGKKA